MTSDGSNPRTFGNVLGMLQLAAILLQFAGLIWLGGRWSAEMNATAERVRELLSRHLKYTGSSRAKDILDNWGAYLPKFVKVMPVEYARALKELEEAQKASDGTTIGVKRSA